MGDQGHYRITGLPGGEYLVEADLGATRTSVSVLVAGGRFNCPNCFRMAWCGDYLTHPAFHATHDFVAAFPTGSGVIMDFGLPRHALPPHELESRDRLVARVQSIGEPFQLFFTPAEIAAELTAFQAVEDLGQAEINARYFRASYRSVEPCGERRSHTGPGADS
jgi:hypothetical protein